MKMWMHRCHSSHKECSANSKAFLPTRLIDVEALPRGCLDVQLVDSAPLKLACDRKGIAYPGYIALSHCWGPEDKQPIATNNDTLEARRTRINFKDLSDTFFDAVTVTRSLGQRYLWIDSLCIIQKDEEDWAREARRMADVYGNALCTLSALSSEDGTQGCRINENLRESTGNSFVDFPSNRANYESLRIYCHQPTPWSVEYGDKTTGSKKTSVRSPLRTRGWTLQEAELSRRNIFFADRQLLWRCRELKGSAELPWAEEELSTNPDAKPWPLCDGLQDDLTEGVFAEVRLCWYRLVEEYSLRDLKYDSDKLTALAGLARDYQKNAPGADYAAGMWGPHHPLLHPSRAIGFPFMKDRERLKLHTGMGAIAAHCTTTLLWHSVDNKARRYDDYVAPTWSWASIKGRISYDSQRIEPHGNSFDRMGVQEQLSDCDFGDLQWGAMFAQPANGDKYGAVKTGAHLLLSGALIAQCTVPSKPFSGFPVTGHDRKGRQDSLISHLMRNIQFLPQEKEETVMEGEPLTVQGRLVGVFLRDSSDDDQFPNADTFCLRVRGEPFFSLRHHDFKSQQEAIDMDMVMGVVLVRVQDQELGETYQRIGLARWVSATIFQYSHPVGIKLI
jgi:hypothetical protein